MRAGSSTAAATGRVTGKGPSAGTGVAVVLGVMSGAFARAVVALDRGPFERIQQPPFSRAKFAAIERREITGLIGPLARAAENAKTLTSHDSITRSQRKIAIKRHQRHLGFIVAAARAGIVRFLSMAKGHGQGGITAALAG